MRRIERVEKETKEMLAAQIRGLQRMLAPPGEGEDVPMRRPWLDVEGMKKFEDVSWAKEQYINMVMGYALGASSCMEALKTLMEAQGKFHEPPRRGMRKI